MFVDIKPVHFIGIGGAGMYPLAEVLAANGYTVTGSDALDSQETKRLNSIGIRVQIGHEPDLIKNAGLVIYTAAVRDDNPEMVYAIENNIRAIKRAKALGDMMKTRFSIGISGTHGKTTTTAITGTLIRDAGFDPTVIVGGTMVENRSNAIIGKNDVLITEADEYDRSFLQMQPAIAVVTNIEEDHLNIYSDIDDLKRTFLQFVEKVPFYGTIIACADEKNVIEVVEKANRNVVTYGINEKADYRILEVETVGVKSTFAIFHNENKMADFELSMTGLHNIRNATASIVCALEIGIEIEKIKTSLACFKGVHRRFEVVGESSGITIVNDYAHHPTEIKGTIEAAKGMGFKRVIAVFQPHLFSRTEDFLDGFAQELSRADKSIVIPIYKAREEYTDRVSGNDIVKKMIDSYMSEVEYLEDKQDLISKLKMILKEGDILLMLGAGDIWEEASPLLKELSNG